MFTIAKRGSDGSRSEQVGRRVRQAAKLTTAVMLALVMAAATINDARPPRTAASGTEANDRHATLGESEGPVSSTGMGLPPQRGMADAVRATHHQGPVPAPASKHESEEVETGESSNAYSTRYLKYQGGAVQTSPHIYLVLWGSSWGTSTGDPYGVASRLHYFYQGLGGSSLANVLKQYSDSTGSFTNPTGQYKGWIQDLTAVPANPTQTDMANAAIRAAQRMGDINYNAQYVIATPWGVVDQKSTANGWCAWHNYTYVGSTWITYTAMPYTPYMDALGRVCGGNKVNAGSAGIMDGVTINAGHEYAETVNDPGLNAWMDSDLKENGDKCSWISLANIKLTNGYYFPSQPTWSNTWRTQYGNGCLYSS